jgi:hypothetical protein
MQKDNKKQLSILSLMIRLVKSINTLAYVIIAVILIGMFLKPRKINLLPPMPNVKHIYNANFLDTSSFMQRVKEYLPNEVTNIWVDARDYFDDLNYLDFMEMYWCEGSYYIDELQYLGIKSEAQREYIHEECQVINCQPIEYVGIYCKEKQEAIFKKVEEENCKREAAVLAEIERTRLRLSKMCYCHLKYWPY